MTSTRFSFFLIIFINLILFISCKVTQPYTQQAVPSVLSYRNSVDNDTTNIANISWRDLFSDTTLQSLLQEGIANNLDLKVAVARIKSAAATFKQSKQAFFPDVSAGATASAQKVASTQFGFPYAYQLDISASWETNIWGKISSAKRASLAALLKSDAYKRAVQTQLIADIASNYYLLLAYDAQLQITQKTVDNRIKEVETMKALKESNIVTGAAVVQSEANRYSVEVTIPDLTRNIRETENAISILLGRSPDTVYRSALEQQSINTELKAGVPAQLLANRPDVQEAEYQVRNSFELINVARTYFYPSLNITGRAGFSNTSISKVLNLSSFFSSISGNLTQPIFNKGLNKERLAVAQANQEEDLSSFKKTLLTASEEVSNALFSYQTALDKESLREQEITYLQKSVDYTKELLKYSSATNYTDVLTSEQSLLTAQLNSINDKLQQLTAMVNLYRSLGGGWK